jgi:MoxR-like ATPase
MAEIDPKTLDALRKAFKEFKQEPLFQLQVKIRRHRSAELQQLLANPDAIDLATFNREVWRLESYSTKDGQDVTEVIYQATLSDSQDLTPEQVVEFDAALNNGQLSFHGNSIWGSGTHIYGAALKISEDEKIENIHRALHILNDAALSPIEKAQRINGIQGFGYNIASGLVMVYHPKEFALYNTPPRDVLKEIGMSEKTLESFQASMKTLREALQAEDYLELDWFLYLVHEGVLNIETQPKYWWVNQGGTYAYESAEGYIWAPITSRSGRAMSHHQALRKVQPGDVIFHYAQGTLRAVSRVTEGYVEEQRPAQLSELRWEPEGYLVRTDYTELPEPIPLQDIPLAWRNFEGGPFTKQGAVKQGYLFPVTYQFAERMGAKYSGLMPDFVPRGSITQRVWIFQANPKLFDLQARLAELDLEKPDADNTEEWTVSRYESQMQSGDIALIWQAGPNAGIYAVAEITGTFFDRPASFNPNREIERAAELRFKQVFHHPITKDELIQHPVLRNLQIIRIPQGTNFSVTHEEWESLQPLLARQVTEVPEYVAPSFEQIRDEIAKSGLRIKDDRLRQYHLALTTSRFLILAGNSGTGKTWLAQAYADAVKAESKLVAVAPNWNTNEDLLGYYNPFEQAYNDTEFSRFLRKAASDYEHSSKVGIQGKPYHLILDEMNLARVEYYFARFLSAMELTSRGERGVIELGPDEQIILPPTLHFIGTVNIDETTHAFADKIYDRAQLIQLDAPRDLIAEHLGDTAYAPLVLELWDAVHRTAPFSFRVIDQMKQYIREAEDYRVPWDVALDEQVLHKILPKIKGAEPRVGETLTSLLEISRERLPLSYEKVVEMHDRFKQHGFTSFF